MGRELTEKIDLSFARRREVKTSETKVVFEYGLSDANDPLLIDADNNGKLLIASFAVEVTCDGRRVSAYAALSGQNGWYITRSSPLLSKPGNKRVYGNVVITADEALLVD